ncbi:WD40 repeat domain-containing protein [Candidatus Albibeggiatoa sp. nov. NOAA]|uniref:WD40 repeat domain-containing protein n=1 Tax=Candidatus Albibeggiatoa sp. nov. NOAA TaxID=3162724 RepID=UPI0032FFC948|nr:WD40 repeat domain-containing protein [Thiotrichaceae bacterium]
MSEYPYPGLRPFARHETDIFFGRETHIDQLIEQLSQGEKQFLAVVGPSGSGKSSLVRTGLLSALEQGLFASAGSRWKIAEMHPSRQPFQQLAEALLADNVLGPDYFNQFDGKLSFPEGVVYVQSNHLYRGPFGLHEFLQQTPLPSRTNLLILVDQFEELFRYGSIHRDDVTAFIALLLQACQHPNVYVVITMRLDFLGECQQFHHLPEAISQGLFLTPRLQRDQLRDAIEQPIKVFGGEIEPILVTHLLNDMNDDPDPLPLMQHVLMQMWWQCQAKGKNTLTLSHYQELGGLTKSLSRHADQAFTELNPKQRRIAEILFRNLCESIIDRPDLRHPIRLDDVATLAEVEWQQVAEVVDVFRRSSRRFLMPPPEVALKPSTLIDITHESLIRHWVRLQAWTSKERESVKLYLRLADCAVRWKQDKAELWSGVDLALATRWRDQEHPNKVWAQRFTDAQEFPIALKFLKASEKAEQEAKERQLRSARIVALAAILIAVILAVLAGYSYVESENAKHAEHLAERAEQKRTEELFQSKLTHAGLSAQIDDYAQARELLAASERLDDKVPASRVHARNLLQWFSNKLMSDSPIQTYTGVDVPLYALDISPSQQLLVAGGEKGKLVLFDVETGDLIREFVGHEQTVKAVVFHSGGQCVISAGNDGKLVTWIAGSGEIISTQQTAEQVYALALSSDGQYLASGGNSEQVQLWKVLEDKSLEPLNVLTGNRGSISRIAFNKNNTHVAAVSDKGYPLMIWDIETGRPVGNERGFKGFLALDYAPDNQHIATLWGSDKTGGTVVRLFDSFTDKTTYAFKGHTNNVFSLKFLQQGKLLASASRDSTIRIWDVENGAALRVLQGHHASINMLISNAQQNELFSAGYDGKILRWDVNTPYQRIALPSEPASVAISPNNQWVAVGFADGILRLYRAADGVLLAQYAAHGRDVQRLDFSPNGQYLISASFDRLARLWEVTTDGLVFVQNFSGHEKAIYSATFAPDNKTVATASYDGHIGLFTIGEEQGRLFKAHEDRVHSVDFDSTGKQLVSGSRDGITRLWYLDQEWIEDKPRFDDLDQVNSSVMWASFSPDDQRIAITQRNQLVKVYDVQARRIEQVLEGHEQTIHRAIFSPDSAQLVTASGDTTVRFWDLETQQALFKIQLPTISGNALWDVDFQCDEGACQLAVPLTQGELLLYNLGEIY